MTLLAGTLARGGRLERGWVEIDGRRISATGAGKPPRRADEHCAGVIAPGLFDLQVNGAGGHEVADGTDAIDAVQLDHGVTSYLPTLVSPDDATAKRILPALARRAADASSPVAGVHVEGPFLNPDHAGVHPRARLRSPADGVPDWLFKATLVTLAPELPGALDLISELVRDGVAVALGHSGADAHTTLRAIDAGATLATHLFNAMAPLSHRPPGLAVVALLDERVRPMLIADGMHVDPLMLELARRAAARRVTLVSDATPAAAAPPGRYTMSGFEIECRAGEPALALDGTIAGSTLTLDAAVRNWSSMTSATLAEALLAAGELPARAIGLGGGLEAGAPADLVLVADAGNVERVMKGGRWVR